jgi:DNA replication ATP-dependent helicase Dna2
VQEYQRTMSISDIRAAIGAELEATPEYYDFKVRRSERDGHLWRVTVQPGSAYAEGSFSQVVLDDSFDGASVWWGGPPKGAASVLTVISEDDQLILTGATSPPPGAEQLIRLYPPRFLQALAMCWQDSDWAARAFACLPDLGAPATIEANPLSGHAFRWLRRGQRRALKMVNYSSSFVWGPPGTGKTTALGVILAEYLHVNPRARVLLLSTTNHAVDQATLAVDKALEQVGREVLRQAVKRVGSRFIAGHYAGREHLLPVLDRELISRLAKAEAERPPSTDIAVYSAWAERVEDLRRQVRAQSIEVLRSCRLASMTTTRAAFSLADLRELPVFDLVVFDEASQVGLAHALAFMPLGRARLFAGDPKQLSPVVRSQARYPQRWLARSPFSEKPSLGPSVCLLDEQSRMAEPISDMVSHLFYDGELRVAADALRASAWLATRTFEFGSIGSGEHVSLPMVVENGIWSQAFRGPIRYGSAELISKLLKDVADQAQVPAKDIIVLTPFRAQRALLRQRLNAHGVKNIKVSTVHRAQGSEALVVIFDPTDAANAFLLTEEAKRLINVALSRAQAKIVLVLSPGDAANPVFAQILNRVRLAHDPRTATPISELVHRPGFPGCAVGLRVAIARHVGEVSRVARDGKVLWMHNENTGAEQSFDVTILRQKYDLHKV